MTRTSAPRLIVAAVAAVIGLLLLVLMIFAAPTLVRWGLVGNVWFVLLLALGLCAGLVTFALFKSLARYRAKALGSKIELGGPAVVVCVVIGLGFRFVPSPVVPFDVTVFLQTDVEAPSDALAHAGELTVDLGHDRRIEPVGAKGEVRLVGVPPNQRGREVRVGLKSDTFELADADARLRLDGEAHYLQVVVKHYPLAGLVVDERGNAVAGARVEAAGHFTATDDDGRFALNLRANLETDQRALTIRAPGFQVYRVSVTPGGGDLEVVLERLQPA